MHTLNFLLLSLAIIWPFGQILEIPFIISNAHFYLLDLITVFLSISLIFNSKSRQFIKKDPLTKPILIFSVVASFSLLLTLPYLDSQNFLIAILYLLRWFSYTSIYYAFRLTKPSPKHFEIILFSLGAFTIFGLIQYLFLPDTRVLYYLGFDDHFYRLIGTFFDPNFTGLVLVIFILFLLSTEKYKLYAVLPSIALALTYSRASFLTLILVFLYLIIRSPKKIYLPIIFLIPLALYFSPKPYGEGVNLFRTFSITSRITDSQYGLELFREKPLLGHGFNTLRSIKGSISPSYLPNRAAGGFSNSFIFILVTTGIIGLLSYLNLLYQILKITWSNPYLNATVIAIIFHSLFNNSLFYIWILSLLWIITAYRKP